MGKSPVTPVQPSANTNRGTEERTNRQGAASPDQRTAHVLLSASIAPPKDLAAQAMDSEALSLDESIKPGHVSNTDSLPQVAEHVHSSLPSKKTP